MSFKRVIAEIPGCTVSYAPHISEELWNAIGCSGSVLDAVYPEVEKEYLVETSKEYPIAINGKTRTTMMLALEITQEQIEQLVMQEPVVQKWLEGKQPKKSSMLKQDDQRSYLIRKQHPWVTWE